MTLGVNAPTLPPIAAICALVTPAALLPMTPYVFAVPA